MQTQAEEETPMAKQHKSFENKPSISISINKFNRRPNNSKRSNNIQT